MDGLAAIRRVGRAVELAQPPWRAMLRRCSCPDGESGRCWRRRRSTGRGQRWHWRRSRRKAYPLCNVSERLGIPCRPRFTTTIIALPLPNCLYQLRLRRPTRPHHSLSCAAATPLDQPAPSLAV
jgi:hypothetical protein